VITRLLVGAVLMATVLTLAAVGRPPAGHAAVATGPVSRRVAAAWLDGVTAMSGASAWAAGGFETSDGSGTLIEHWDGRGWKPVLKMRNQPHQSDSLSGVAAASAASVFAAGTSVSQCLLPVIERRDGRGWSLDQTPLPGADGGDAYLNGVAATSARDAWAVGGYYPGRAADTLVFGWNGRKWAQVPSPSPGGTSDTSFSVLKAVSALSPTDVWAVGDYGTGRRSAAVNTLVEHWNGTRWVWFPSPSPARAGCAGGRLTAVAAAPGATWAVGSYCGAPLTLRLTGGRWQQVPAPLPPVGVSEHLSSVAVTSEASAWAVGNIDGDRILVLHWNGTKWARSQAPAPAAAMSAVLTSVSAVSRTTAWAVGKTVRRGVTRILIERWNGRNWKLVPVPNPTP